MKNLQTTLQGITMANGYANTLNAVERVLQQGQSSQPPMAYLLEANDTVTAEAPLGFLSREMLVGVVLVVQQDEAIDSRSASEVMNSLIADVQRALQVDERRGNLAVLTKETDVSAVQIIEGMPELSATVAYSIHYRHNRLDATVVG